jgi:hypothetical protein
MLLVSRTTVGVAGIRKFAVVTSWMSASPPLTMNSNPGSKGLTDAVEGAEARPSSAESPMRSRLPETAMATYDRLSSTATTTAAWAVLANAAQRNVVQKFRTQCAPSRSGKKVATVVISLRCVEEI